ncbi:MAG TPA: DEAD/DEAH box helicase [Gammaproteobacteria bacterium]|nr:DEAD/DEAH box helicase [Gammaproteobacteria bacterium]
MTDTHLTDTKFVDFELPQPLLDGLNACGFLRCTPIQKAALPLLLGGQDVAGQAQTGTGKTAAFLVALFTHLWSHDRREGVSGNTPRALILAPTRELAIQIHEDALKIAAATDFRLALVYGGTGYEQQKRLLNAGVDVLIGTPGRLLDLYKQKLYGLQGIQVCIMDEADRMFDLGFIRDVRYFLRRMPPAQERLNMLFSATLSLRVNELAYEHMNNPQMIKIDADRVSVERIVEQVYYPGNEDKVPLLVGLLRKLQPRRALIFVNTRWAAEKVQDCLNVNELNAGMLSGGVVQNKREALLRAFKAREINLLVATDVAARGLHIPEVTHVFNFDLPQEAEDYVHRIGRTARAGAEGMAVSFACETYAISLPDIETYIGHSLPHHDITPELLPRLQRSRHRPHASVAQRREGKARRPVAATARKPAPKREQEKDTSPIVAVTAGLVVPPVTPASGVPSATISPKAEPALSTSVRHSHHRKKAGIREIPAIG